MKTVFKKSFAVLAASLMMLSFSMSTFATNAHFNRGYGYNTNYYQYSVYLKNGLGSEKITVVNTCNSPINVYIGGIYRGQLTTRNSELTVAYSSGGTKTVKIQPTKTTTHSFRIKTTGYSDTITRTR